MESILEIVIDGISMQAVKKAMRAGIYSVKEMEGVTRISAGNYEGRLGRHKIYLKELLLFESNIPGIS